MSAITLVALAKCGHHVLIAAKLRNCCLPGGYRHMVRIRAPTSAWVRDDAERALLALSSTTGQARAVKNDNIEFGRNRLRDA